MKLLDYNQAINVPLQSHFCSGCKFQRMGSFRKKRKGYFKDNGILFVPGTLFVYDVHFKANSFYIIAQFHNKSIFLIDLFTASYASRNFYQSITCLYYKIFKKP